MSTTTTTTTMATATTTTTAATTDPDADEARHLMHWLARLPEPVLRHVTSYLPPHDLFTLCAGGCRLLFHTLSDETMWETLCTQHGVPLPLKEPLLRPPKAEHAAAGGGGLGAARAYSKGVFAAHMATLCGSCSVTTTPYRRCVPKEEEEEERGESGVVCTLVVWRRKK